LQALDPTRPVYVEAESRKVGNLHVPEALIAHIRNGECLQVDATLAARVVFLLQDYDYFLADPAFLLRRLDALRGLQSNENLQRWQAYIAENEWPVLVKELLEQHYDPLYHRSQGHNFSGLANARHFTCNDLSPSGIAQLAAELVQSRIAQIA